ncbi:MAG: metallophosphoesterase [Tannerella sp.]|jgi:hypothetical protein|nr:metallophosphoesterase [Tannerella sp.]
MKKIILTSLFITAGIIHVFAAPGDSLRVLLSQIPESAVNFIIANDLGRNGYYEQKPVARLMAFTAENTDIEMVAAAGDVHHFEGVESVHDPLWMTNYELIYDHPELMIEWNVVCGNHEYRGNTQAILDYTRISRRWNAPSRYFTKVIEADDGMACRLVFIDTTPLMDKYRNDTIGYPDAHRQDADRQLQWIDSVLLHSTEKWKIVIGHHPVYAETKKEEAERADMRKRLAPILEKNHADAYFCGHIHNFQHIKPASSPVHYIVNSSASLSRTVKPTPETLYCSPDAGFTICSVTDCAFTFYFVNHKGLEIYRYTVTK